VKATTTKTSATKAQITAKDKYDRLNADVKQVYDTLTSFATKTATNHEIRVKLNLFAGAGYDKDDIDQGKRIRRILRHLVANNFATEDKSHKKGEKQQEFLYKSLDILSK
jgi:hypothetical protein